MHTSLGFLLFFYLSIGLFRFPHGFCAVLLFFHQEDASFSTIKCSTILVLRQPLPYNTFFLAFQQLQKGSI